MSYEKIERHCAKYVDEMNYLPPAGRLVHLRGCGAPVLVAILQEFAGFAQVLDVNPSEIYNKIQCQAVSHTHTSHTDWLSSHL